MFLGGCATAIKYPHPVPSDPIVVHCATLYANGYTPTDCKTGKPL